MKCTILGCGGSMGVPQLCCSCRVCTSDNPKNIRTRCSLFIESAETKILVDTAPDFRAQALKNNITSLNALIYTHTHFDHIAGIDEVKPFAFFAPNKMLDTYMTEETAESLKKTNFYAFESHSVYKPFLNPKEIGYYDNIKIGDINLQLFKQEHGQNFHSLGIRIGNVAYSTDVNNLPYESLKVLEGVDTWMIDCLRYNWAPTHYTFEKTLELIDFVKPKRAILIHMAHEIDYDEIKKILPENVEPAFDGMVIDIKS